jgi:hypothetical protein
MVLSQPRQIVLENWSRKKTFAGGDEGEGIQRMDVIYSYEIEQ